MLGSSAVVYSVQPSIMVISDNRAGTDAARAAATALGGRVLADISLTEAVLRLENQVSPNTLMLELTADTGARLDRTLDQIDRIATRDSMPMLVSIAPDLIDVVSARIRNPLATVLCSPSPAERIAAIALAWEAQHASVNDRSQEFDALRLQHLADEVGRIAKTLAAFNETPSLSGTPAKVGDAVLGYKFQNEVFGPEEIGAGEIRAIIKLRRLRDRHFDPELFADPAWDMMLDLMAARAEHTRVSVSSLCIAAAVPATTALRWIKTLTDQGVFVRVADPTDGRRVFIELSDKATANIAKYFAAMKKAGGCAV